MILSAAAYCIYLTYGLKICIKFTNWIGLFVGSIILPVRQILELFLSDRQVNFKWPYTCTTNNITMKMIPFPMEIGAHIHNDRRKIQKRFWCGPVKSNWRTITIFVYERRLFTSKTYSKFVTLDHFYMIYSRSKYSEKQTNFKLADDNNINNGTTGKTKPIQRKKLWK